MPEISRLISASDWIDLDFVERERTPQRAMQLGIPTNRFLHVRLFSTYTTVLSEMFLRELREKHDIENVEFLVDDAQWLQTALQRHGLDFRYEPDGNRNTIERIFREVKRRTSSFSNCFSHVDPATAENWLQTFAVWWNSLN